MLEAASALSGLGFSPLNYVEMWSNASRPARARELFASASASAPATTARSLWSTPPTPSTTQVSGASPWGSTEEIDLEVELSIARLRAAAQEALRNRSAQLATGGSFVRGGGSFAYAIGPDGELYATGVTLSYDTSAVTDDPQATILKMQQVRAAALASSTPTASDLAAAATATQVEMQARLELVQQAAQQYLGSDTTTQPGTLLRALA